MKKITYIFLLICLIVSILGCSKVDSSKEPTEPSKPSENIEFQDNIDTEVDEKIPAHSQLYNSNYTQDKILTYFKEVVLNMEYIDGTGDVSCVQKWLSPIYYNIYGSYTDYDLTKLYELFTQLNDINGFPGIYPASDENIENLTISFLEPNDFTYQFSDVINGEDAFGATEFWYYTDTNEIHTARIGYRTDSDQITQNSIMLEEVINSLGISDSTLRLDSIVYQNSNDNLVLSDVDIIILKLLYNQEIQCGMNYESCREIIENLYY